MEIFLNEPTLILYPSLDIREDYTRSHTDIIRSLDFWMTTRWL